MALGPRRQLSDDQALGAEKDKRGFFEILPAAFRQENAIGSTRQRNINAGEENLPHMLHKGNSHLYNDEEFDPFDDIAGTDYAPYAKNFIDVRNAADAARVKHRLDRELADKRFIGEASGPAGFMANMLAGLTSPEVLIPVGGSAVKGLKGSQSVLRNAGRTAVAGGVGATITEAVLQPTQDARTAQESMFNIMGGMAFGGVLGGGVGAFASRSPMKFKDIAMLETKGPQAQIKMGSSAGAMEVVLDPKMEMPTGSLGVGKAFAFTGPLQRVMYKSGSGTAMKSMLGLAEQPYLIQKNEQGIASIEGGSIETVAKRVMGDVVVVEDIAAELFSQYRVGQSAGIKSSLQIKTEDFRGTDKLNQAQFMDEISVALERGEHDVPEVQEAAKSFRAIMDAIGKEAEDAGIIPQGLLGKKTRAGTFYRPMLYQMASIRKKRSTLAGDGFEDIVSKHYQTNAGRAKQDFELAQKTSDELKERKATELEARKQELEALSQRRAEHETKVLSREDINNVKRYAGKKTGPKFPILAMLRERGGVKIGSVLAGELRNLGLTPQKQPGLFRKNGELGDVDNIVGSEEELFHGFGVDDTGYLDPADIYSAISEELAGNPIRPDTDLQRTVDGFAQMKEDWETLGVDFSKPVDDIRNDMMSHKQPDKEAGFLSSKEELSPEDADYQASLDQQSSVFGKDDHDRMNQVRQEIRALETADSRRQIEKLGKNEDNDIQILERIFGEKEARRIYELEEKMELLQKLADADDPALARQLARETTDKILGMSEADAIRPPEPGLRGMLKERLLDIDPAQIREFSETNAANVLRRYARTVSTDVEMVKRFGDVEMTKAFKDISDDFAQMRLELSSQALVKALRDDFKKSGPLAAWVKTPAGGAAFANMKKGNTSIKDTLPDDVLELLKADKKYLKELDNIAKREKDTIRDVKAVRDRLRGMYNTPEEPDSFFNKAERSLLAWNYMRLLGGMTISAMPDMAMGIFRNGLKRNAKIHMKMMGSAASYKASRQEMKAMGIGTEMALDSRLRSMVEYQLHENAGDKAGRLGDNMVKTFGKVTLMTPWNATQKQINGIVFGNFVVDTARKIVNGTASKKEIREMASWNIDAKLAQKVVDQIERHAPDYDNQLMFNMSAWDDVKASNDLRSAIITQVDKTILTPGQEKPLWMSKSGRRLAGQFKSFAFAATQMIAVSGMQRRSAEQLSGIMALVTLGMMTYAIKEKSAGRELPPVDVANSGTWLKNGIDRSGVTGILMDGNNMLEKFSGQQVGISPMLAKAGIADNKIASRYRNRNTLGTLFGPSAGVFQDVADIGSGVAGELRGDEKLGLSEGDIGKARRLIPFQNALGIKKIFDEFEEGMERQFGEHPDQK